MENGDISDSNIKASSEFELPILGETTVVFYAKNARLNSEHHWAASNTDSQPWVQADVGYQTVISGLVTQGDGMVVIKDWVTSFKVSTFSTSLSPLFTQGDEDFIVDENGNHLVNMKFFVFSS